MQLESHQLDRRWEHLRVHHPARQRRLLASLAESRQQTPIVLVAPKVRRTVTWAERLRPSSTRESSVREQQHLFLIEPMGVGKTWGSGSPNSCNA
jgi:hypothetical protein